MAKELIISANVHEKKVAIIEDGVVTEFYVERRDENQGVVGNLYKGRVMKVLPGMQSAFVDIGLERDAFLYVSDFTEFMDEEDEIDFKEADEEQRAAAPREDRQRRGERGRAPLPAAAAKPAPGRAGEDERAERPLPIEDVVEQLAEIADESVIPPPPQEDDLGEETATDAAREAAEADMGGVAAASVDEFVFERVSDDVGEAPEEEPPARPEAAEADEAMQREHDIPAQAAEQEAEAAATAEKPKRSRSRKKAAKVEQAEPVAPKPSARAKKKPAKAEEHAEASKSKTKATARRTSRKRAAAQAEEEPAAEQPTHIAPQFERITDEDRVVDDERTDAGELLKDAIVQEKIIDRIHSDEYKTGIAAREPEPEWRVGSFRPVAPDAAPFQRIDDDASEASFQKSSEMGPAAIGDEEEAITPFRHISDAVPAEFYNKAMTESAGELGEIGGLATSDESDDERERRGFSEAVDEVEGEEASIRDRGSRAEFAVRRGGRSRRRRREPPAAAAEEEKGVPAVAVEEPEAAASSSDGQKAGEAHQRPSDAHREPARAVAPRRPDARHERRPDGQRRPEAPMARRPERGMPTISDLLHEGQEILVQIAKEPIAKKGARITSHIALPGRYLVYMPTVNHVGVSRKIASEAERIRLKRVVTMLREREGAVGGGGFIARTACAGHTEQELQDDMRYLLRTWADVRKKAERTKAPALVHRDLDLVQRILRDQLSEEFSAIRVDNETEYALIVEFVNRVQPRLVKRVKLYTGNQPILEKYSVQPEIDKAVRPRVWLKSGGYIVINQTEALVAIDVNTGKFVGKSDKLEDTITRTNLEAAKEIVRQVRLRDLGGIIVIDFIDMEERKNRQRVMMALQQELQTDRAPSKILSINDFGLVAITRKRVKQSLERTLCTPCPYCQGAGMVKSPQTMCFEILEQAKAITKGDTLGTHDVMLRVSPDVAESLRSTEREVLEEIEGYFGLPVTIEADPNLHQEQYDFALV
jgi:ribonuclease G